MSRRWIAFTNDKNGRPIAYRYCRLARRWIKVNLEEAKFRVASGADDEVEYRKM
jgi:hypothetical protein